MCSFICYSWAEFWFTDQRYQHDHRNKLKEMLKPYITFTKEPRSHSIGYIPKSNQCAECSIKVMQELYYMYKNKDKLQLRFILYKKH